MLVLLADDMTHLQHTGAEQVSQEGEQHAGSPEHQGQQLGQVPQSGVGDSVAWADVVLDIIQVITDISDNTLTSSVTAERLLMAELTVEREPENIPATARPGSPGTEDILSTM